MNAFHKPLLNVLKYVSAFGVIRGLQTYARLRLGSKGGLVRCPIPGSQLNVWLRHRTVDVSIWEEIFIYSDYDAKERINNPEYIIDAGAHIGLTSVFYAFKYPMAKIFAIEPDQDNFELLLKNTSNFANVTPVHAALWKDSQMITFKSSNSSSVSGACSDAGGDGNQVPAISVDRLMADHHIEVVDLLKVDIEGAEREVFNNASAWIDSVRNFALEFHDYKLPDCERAFVEATRHRQFDVWRKGANLLYFDRAS